MSEYLEIKSEILRILVPLGYKEVKSDTELNYCGSLHSIYCKGDKRFMIQWDGEEGFGSVESWSNKTWKMLNTIVPESSDDEYSVNIKALCNELKLLA